MRLQTRGVNLVDPGEADVSRDPGRRRLPRRLLLHHQPRDPGPPRRPLARRCANPEMDCGLVVERDADGAPARVYTLPMSDVRAGMLVVCGASGIRVERAEAGQDRRGASGSWSPRCPRRSRRRCWCARSPTACARPRPRARRCSGSGGPGVVHTGAAPAMVAMVNAGFVDVLFAGNALATHDIESSLYGTSLGRRPGHGPRRRARPRAPHPARSTPSARRARSARPSRAAC